MNFFRKPAAIKRNIDPLEPIPVGETKDVDWAEWEDSVGFQDDQASDNAETVKQPISPADGHFMDAFMSVRTRPKK
jgi:hypothetical protein